MFELYKPISNLDTVPVSDITQERNSLGYLVLGPSTSINIPVTVKLYDYIKFKEIIDTTFTEIFPNDNIPPNTLDLQAQINALQAQLSGSQTQIDNLNTIIDGLQAPGAELELWRTRKTFKRIVDGAEPLYPSGFPTVNNLPYSAWSDIAGAVSKVLGPPVSNEEQTWIEDMYGVAALIQALYNINPTNINTLAQVTFFNELGIPGLSISNNTYAPSSITDPIIIKLQDVQQAGTVLEQEINILTYQSMPTCYLEEDPNTHTKPINSIQEFRKLCKKIVYWNQFIANTAPQNLLASNVAIHLLENINTVGHVINQLDKIAQVESNAKTQNPTFNVDTYFEDIA